MIEDSKQFASAIAQIAEEKGISQDKILETIEAAIAAAYKKDYAEKGQDIRAKFDLKTGSIKIYKVKTVITKKDLESEDGEAREINPEREIMLANAKKEKKNIKSGEEIKYKLKSKEDFGRIAAQTAKQVIIQKIREAERESIYEEFKDRQGEIISGIVQRIEGSNVFIDIGRATGILFPNEQIPKEHYRIGQRIKVYLVELREEAHESGVLLSRANPDMIRKLFEIEVPEIASGAVEIKAIAREAGDRSKIAVMSHEDNIDPIGSLVGQKGARVQTVINELGGEMVDIIEYDKNMKKFIANSLAPAKISKVEILDKEGKKAQVIVPKDQLSLAIGKHGQNVRLAAKLTGWKIDAVAEKEKKKEKKKGEKKNKKE